MLHWDGSAGDSPRTRANRNQLSDFMWRVVGPRFLERGVGGKACIGHYYYLNTRIGDGLRLVPDERRRRQLLLLRLRYASTLTATALHQPVCLLLGLSCPVHNQISNNDTITA